MNLLIGIPGHVNPTITITVVIAGMLVLAAFDVWRHEVEDVATLALLVVAVVGLGIQGIQPAQWVSGVASAAIAFVVYLYLGTRGVMGGGDVKLSVVPALVLGASNPFLGIWWIGCAILLHQVLIFGVARSMPRPAGASRVQPMALPHVPAMAAAALIATVAFPAIP